MELKSNELRIGNLVKEIDFNRIGVVKTIGKDRFSIKLEKITLACSIKIIKPIPLTEEWLLKFGFAKQCDYLYFDFENGNISFNDEIKKGISLCIGTYCSSGLAFENIKHVHQLQNLFFALTGEELKLIH